MSWPSDLTVTLSGDELAFSGNNLPGHPTGSFPVEASDNAYQYDRNPNSITGQDVAFTLDAAPVVLDTPECAGGSVGYMLTGGYLFNGFDARTTRSRGAPRVRRKGATPSCSATRSTGSGSTGTTASTATR